MSEELATTDPNAPAPETEESAPDSEGLRGRIEGLQRRFQELPLQVRLGVIGAIVMAIAGSILMFAQGSEAPMEVLFSGLGPDDNARIVDRLSRMGVPFDNEEAGTLRVPGNRVHELRLTLAGEGLPSGGGVGFEVFDEPRFGESEFSEQVQYHRALEGELSRSISHLAGVERARVHLVLPQRSLFVNRDRDASGSVVLHLRPGWSPRSEQVRGIVHLVASSVRGLEPDAVTVVDGEGRDLMGAEDENTVGDALAYRQRIEENKAETVQALLDDTLGPGVARVTVAADVSFRREERTEERYLPDEVAARSFQITEERDQNANAGAEGVPGAASNLPGGDAPEAGGGAQNLSRRSETRNFEVSKTVRHAVEPVGRIERLQVAVVVDGTWEEEAFTPRSEEELSNIEAMAAHAAGLDENRGDRISVTSIPFHRLSAEELAALEPSIFEKLRPWMPYISGLVLLLVGLGLYFRKQKLEEAARKEAEEAEAAAKALEEGGGEEGEDGPTKVNVQEVAGGDASAVDRLRELLDSGGVSPDAAQIQLLASDLADEDPERAARVLKTWLKADADKAAAEAEEAAA